MKLTVPKERTKARSKSAAIAPARPRSVPDAVRERIARKAYELWELRGRRHGHALGDWLDAELLVMEELYEARQ